MKKSVKLVKIIIEWIWRTDIEIIIYDNNICNSNA